MNKTDEFSFILKPSTIPNAGIGVFALHPIDIDTKLRIWGEQIDDNKDRARVLKKEDVPIELRGYCVVDGDNLLCPDDFSHMHVGWYLNHSDKPNVRIDNRKWFFALKDIKQGEELFIDYNTLDEPEESKESYY